jgi:acyl-coenzyme A synthetase/AMP-(fatty) acid ligase
VCTFHRVGEPPDPDAPPVSIGRAVANDEVIVVTDDNRIASPGEVGELVVRGATVMRGYWGDPDRTASTMIPSPPTTDPVPGGIADLAYRSGDLVREELDGTLTFLGRRDAQIKRMGYRIELGEIENAYLVQPEVLECAVTTRMDAATAVHVTAHIVLRDGAALDAVTRAGATQLPLYMLPDQFELLPQLPKTVSGKVDRVALRDRAPDADLPMSVPTTEEVS